MTASPARCRDNDAPFVVSTAGDSLAGPWRLSLGFLRAARRPTRLPRADVSQRPAGRDVARMPMLPRLLKQSSPSWAMETFYS